MYRFLELEVVDTDGKPIADAAVGTLKTNQSGRLENGLRVNVNEGVSPIGFSVLKPGYYTFVDYFGIIAGRGRWGNPTRLELLIVPKTAAERAAVGDEQIKRELFVAAKTGDVATVRKLLKSGLDPNLTTTDLRGVPGEKDVPVAVYAASSGDGETVGEFLRAGANVRRKDNSTLDVLAIYLNADPYTRHYDDTEAEKAVRFNAFETGAENLIKAGADTTETNLMTAAAKGLLRTAGLLIQKGVSVNAEDRYGNTTLMYAVNGSRDRKTRLEMINLLLKSGADINAVTNRNNGYYYGCRTALKVAVENGDLGAVELLIKNRAAVNAGCGGTQTALELAKSMIHGDRVNIPKIIKLLEMASAK